MPLPLLRCGLLALLLARLAAWAPGAAAQEGTELVPVDPIEDLQGHYHFSPDDLVAILSTNSLMLTREQVLSIEEAKRLGAEQTGTHEEFAALTQDAVQSSALNQENFQLDAILYLSRQSWTFWLNGQAVTPDIVPEGMAVLEVGPDRVELAWTPDAARPGDVRNFVLAPGQAYLVADGSVVESDEIASQIQSQPDAESTRQDDGDGNDTQESQDGAPVTNAAPGDLALSPEQVEQLSELQQALAIVSGNASALGMTEAELQDLQQSLAASGDTSSLSAEQQEQLLRIQQATGIE